MKTEELQQIADQIIQTGKSDIEWIEEQPKEDFTEEFKEGWKRGIDQLTLELLGRAEEDEAEKLREIIK